MMDIKRIEYIKNDILETYPKSLMSLVDGAWTMIDGGVDFLRVSLVPGDLDFLAFVLVNFSFILDFVLFENDFRTLFLRNLPFSDLNYQKVCFANSLY